MKLLACVDDFFNDFAQLIDLDRKDAPIFAAITELCHRGLKGAINRFNPVSQQILKPDYQWKPKASLARFVNNFEKIDTAAIFLQRLRFEVAQTVDGKVTVAPSFHVVGGNGGLNVPLGFHFDSSCGGKPQSAHSIRAPNMQASRTKIFAKFSLHPMR